MSIEGTSSRSPPTTRPLALPFDCALAAISPDGTVGNLYDESDAPIALAPETAPAPDRRRRRRAATPAPVTLPQPVPAPTTATTPPVPVSKHGQAHGLVERRAVDDPPQPHADAQAQGRQRRLQALEQGQDQRRQGARAVRAPRGDAVRAQARPEAHRQAAREAERAGQEPPQRSRSPPRAGKLKASSALLLRIGKARKAKPTPSPKKSPIVGTFWWRNVNHVDWAWDNRALYFVDGGSVYSGFPKGGLPTTCTTPVAEPDDEFDTREGCLPYSFDAKTGAVTIGDKTGTFKDGKLTIDGEEYTPTVVPEAGARFTINEHKHSSFRGMCGLIMGCTTSQEYLSLAPDGKFILTRSTVSTMGDPGLGPWTAVGSYPPDQQGTYEILAGGKIRLAFADGSVREELFLIDTNRQTRRSRPARRRRVHRRGQLLPRPVPGP